MTAGSPPAVEADPPEGTPAPDRTEAPAVGDPSGGDRAEAGTGAPGGTATATATGAAPEATGPAAAGPPRRTWPASKRARAAARRRARALGTWPPPSAAARAAGRSRARTRPTPLVGWVRGRRADRPGQGPRPPLDGARLRRRRALVATALATTAVAGAGLALLGLSTVRNSTAGRYVDPPIRPDEPGYQAYVASTPTLAVVHRDASGGLAGASLLALRPGDDGGAVVLVPPSTRSPELGTSGGDDEAGGLTVAAAYEGGGADAVADAMADILDVAIDDVVEVDGARWTSLVDPVAPVSLTVDAPVGLWQPGEVELGASDVGAFLAAHGPDEPEVDWMARQAEFWDAWLSGVGTGGEGAVPGELDTGIGRFVRGIARDPSAAILPVTPDEDGGPVLVPDRDRIAELVSRAVPYPLSPAAGRRVRVRLLNGTTDDDLTPAAARLLVAGGAEIAIAGNADSFDVSETTFTYESVRHRAAARRLAATLGVGEVERDDGAGQPSGGTAAEAGDEIDVTIVLGSDAQDLIGRLESAG